MVIEVNTTASTSFHTEYDSGGAALVQRVCILASWTWVLS